MVAEHEYRDMLKKAQQSAEFIQEFLDGLQKLERTRSNPRLVELIRTVKDRAKRLEGELDQVWDLFKRI